MYFPPHIILTYSDQPTFLQHLKRRAERTPKKGVYHSSQRHASQYSCHLSEWLLVFAVAENHFGECVKNTITGQTLPLEILILSMVHPRRQSRTQTPG